MSDNDRIGHIRPALFAFLKELKENNSRAWFQANTERYEATVREPLLQFISDFGLYLVNISRHYVADARKVGGSMFRIHRDVRFSRDKSPYKTHAGIQFRHENGKDVHAPGYYLHLEPDNVFVAAGIWHPDAPTLGKIRDAIVENPKKWQQIFADENFAAIYQLRGDSLQKAPKGYDPDHPLMKDLKLKDYYVLTAFTEAEACDPDFILQFAGVCQLATPFMAFLTAALGLPF